MLTLSLASALLACSDSGLRAEPLPDMAEDPNAVPAADSSAAKAGYQTSTDCSGVHCLVWHDFVADLSSADVDVRATRPGERGQATSTWAQSVGATVAVNGDWFVGNTPLGLAVGNGESWGTADAIDHGFIACDANNDCFIDPENTLEAADPSWTDVVGGNGQELITAGVNLRNSSVDSICGDFCNGDHARSAVGLSDDGSRMFFVVGEGERSGAFGPSFTEVANHIQSLGAWDALMLDGGGSTTMTVDGLRQNVLPSGQGSERAVANHLGLVYDWTDVVGAAEASTGYWFVTAEGRVSPRAGAPDYGDLSGISLAAPVVGMAATPSGAGYWLVAADGGVFSFGDAAFYGSMGSTAMNAPVVGMAATVDGGGYWLVGADGGIFSFGNAPFEGSMGSTPMNAEVVGMAASPGGRGYWLVGADGGVFSFGDAHFYGSTGSTTLAAPVTGIQATSAGYRMIAADGGIFSFGNAAFAGSAVDSLVGNGVAVVPDGSGYRVVSDRGEVLAF